MYNTEKQSHPSPISLFMSHTKPVSLLFLVASGELSLDGVDGGENSEEDGGIGRGVGGAPEI